MNELIMNLQGGSQEEACTYETDTKKGREAYGMRKPKIDEVKQSDEEAEICSTQAETGFCEWVGLDGSN